MKHLKFMVLGLVCSILLACNGVDAASYTEYTILSIEVPGNGGIATVSGDEYHEGGYQYAQTTSTIDKVTQGSRATLARVRAMLTPTGYSSWVLIPNGGGYKNLGNLDLYYYRLQLKENTWSALGFYWFGKWKIYQ